MTELLASLMLAIQSMVHIPIPVDHPTVSLVPVQQLQSLACNNKPVCADLHFFTAPDTGVIYVDEAVDFSYTFAKAELLHEVIRYTLQANKVYSPHNYCSLNVKIESGMEDMELQYLNWAFKSDPNWKGVGVPPVSAALPKHLFFCIPDPKPVELNV